MSPDPTPNRPDDEARDPLLAALQQRLGPYGEAPPPGAWAGIRQQLAAPRAAARPWWRRPRRALPVLALLLLLLAGTGALVHRWQLLGGAGKASHAFLRHGSLTAEAPRLPGTSVRTAARQPTVSAPASTPRPASVPTPAGVTIAKGPAAVAPRQPGSPVPARLGAAHPSGALAGGTIHRRAERLTSTQHLPAVLPNEADWERTAATGPEVALHIKRPSGLTRGPKRRFTRQETDATATRPPAASLAAGGRTRRTSATEQPMDSPRQDKQGGQKEANSPELLHAPPALAGPEAEGTGPQTRAPRRHGRAIVSGASMDAERFRPDLLGLRQPALVLAPGPARPPITARPDSARPAPQPAHRWSLLFLAGPTLSYRTLGPSAADSAARAERPAAGLGAQLQLRRVLSGRWALAAGLGYQEYATRRVLRDSVAGPVPVRDTYRLLTAPVQASYALGVPRGRWAVGVLAGTEVGWYRGGRSTEGSSCNCQQQTFAAVSGPYRSWSLAFSLGLDVRYRLGGPDSRWHWAVQPTGRYVATPFVQPGVVGFAARQPYSLGVFTGFFWDLR